MSRMLLFCLVLYILYVPNPLFLLPQELIIYDSYDETIFYSNYCVFLF